MSARTFLSSALRVLRRSAPWPRLRCSLQRTAQGRKTATLFGFVRRKNRG